MNPYKIQISDYNYILPDNRIADFPLEKRDESKLLVYKKKQIQDAVFLNLPNYLDPESYIVFNNTRVVRARLCFFKENGSKVEVFCLESTEFEPTQAMMQKHNSKWLCFIGGAKKWKTNTQLKLEIGNTILYAVKREQVGKAYIVEFSWEPSVKYFAEILEIFGNIPLPPYIKRLAESIDSERYQTVYAKNKGSVAAPTAGLHFTESLLQRLKNEKHNIEELTLHVGAGTFKPVEAETIIDHEMHNEWIDFEISTLENLSKSTKKCIAVGTTSMRTLESIYWLGVKCILNPKIEISELTIKQWDAFNLPQNYDPKIAIEALLDWANRNKLKNISTQTQLLIAPGYSFKLCTALITNFHQPKSTLLLLIAAILGDSWKEIYKHALDNDYRFLSYGDSSLLFI
jgi:S-adenosylmethionine:tRNA ribosyltransferase-isomerase